MSTSFQAAFHAWLNRDPYEDMPYVCPECFCFGEEAHRAGCDEGRREEGEESEDSDLFHDSDDDDPDEDDLE